MSESVHRSLLRRRDILRLATFGVLGSTSSFLPAMAAQLSGHPARRRHCILLWMPGGASQLDTFDMKPRHANGGEFSESSTTVPGVRFSEHLPTLARWADHMAIVRGLHTSEGDHDRGTYLVRTGQRLGGPMHYPTIGSSLAKQLGDDQDDLPQYVSVAPSDFISPSAFGSGFLGPRYAPATVNAERRVVETTGDQVDADAATSDSRPLTKLGLSYLHPVGERGPGQLLKRAELWNQLQADYLANRSAANAEVHDTVYRRAMRMVHSEAATAFELDKEPELVRRRYGEGTFGQGCLLARRLIERGVPFVEVALGGNEGLAWDTHLNNFPVVRTLSQELDAGWGMLMEDLHDRGLLESTTVLWIGEFGRTPIINDQAGRDHYPQAWTCVFAGGGIQGGAVHGRTSDDGMEVVDGKVAIGDVLSTLCAALGVDPAHENLTELGRPVRLTEGSPIRSILAT